MCEIFHPLWLELFGFAVAEIEFEKAKACPKDTQILGGNLRTDLVARIFSFANIVACGITCSLNVSLCVYVFVCVLWISRLLARLDRRVSESIGEQK